jgi:adenine deaminase
MVCVALPFFRGFNKMAEIDGDYVLVRKSAVVSMLRLEIAGLMTARSVEVLPRNLDQIHVEMN